MPTLREIFGHSVTDSEDRLIIVRDRKPKQCSHVESTEEAPFVKRCTNDKMHNLTVCKSHAYSINYLDWIGVEQMAYFDTVGKAEYFKSKNNWLECNYVIKDED
jgi:hypothetical protein